MGALATTGLIFPVTRKIFPMYSRSWQLRAWGFGPIPYLIEGSKAHVMATVKKIHAAERIRLQNVKRFAESTRATLMTRSEVDKAGGRYWDIVRDGHVVWHFGRDQWKSSNPVGRQMILLGHPYPEDTFTSWGFRPEWSYELRKGVILRK